MSDITLSQLLEAGVHFGHKAYRWNPKMFPYIYTEQNGIHVIDLVQTARLLTHAYSYVQKASKEQQKTPRTHINTLSKSHKTIIIKSDQKVSTKSPKVI